MAGISFVAIKIFITFQEVIFDTKLICRASADAE